MRKLLIADGNEEFRLALTQALCQEFQTVSTGDGQEALDLLCRERPDILVLDTMLPCLDGLTLLERAAEKAVRPLVLLVCSMYTEYVLRSTRRLGIEYIVLKPCDLEAVAARVRDLGRLPRPVAPERDLHKRSMELLVSLRFSSKHDGRDYLMIAIPMHYDDPTTAITKATYPAIAKACGRKPKDVERAIRNAIEKAWENGDRELWHRYFPDHTKRPTNTDFILRMVEVLRHGE